MLVGVARTFETVCLFVCLSVTLFVRIAKTNIPKCFNVVYIGNDTLEATWFWE